MPKSKRKKGHVLLKKDDAVKLIMRKSTLGVYLTDFNTYIMKILRHLKNFKK